MKKIKHYALLLLTAVMALTTTGCGSDYDDSSLRGDIADLQSRVAKLEEWSKTANSQISALQGLVTALEAKDYITGVSPILEGAIEVGYTITFGKSGAITIRNGKDGANGVTPIIGAKKDTDDVYYWTVQLGDAPATWMLDADGKKIRATGGEGSSKSPEISVATDTDGKVYWKVNGQWLLNNGKKVQATGDKGDTGNAGSAGSDGSSGAPGNSVFATNGVDTTDPTKVTFTLANGGGTFSVPRSAEIVIFGSFAEYTVNTSTTTLTLDLNIREGSYTAIKAELTSSKGMSTHIVKATTRAAAGEKWGVSLTEPTFNNGVIATNAIVTFDLPADVADGDFALLKVTVISNGQEHASTRVIVYSTATTPAPGFAVGDYYPAGATKDNAVGVVYWVNPTDATKGKIVSMDEPSSTMIWCTYAANGNLLIRSDTDGFENTAKVKNDINYTDEIYPSIAWCVNKGEGWYMPARDELTALYTVWNADKEGFNAKLNTTISSDKYWVSTEENGQYQCYVDFNDGNSDSDYKSEPGYAHYVRAILAF